MIPPRVASLAVAIPAGLIAGAAGCFGGLDLARASFRNDITASPVQTIEHDADGDVVRPRPKAGEVTTFLTVGAGALVAGGGNALGAISVTSTAARLGLAAGRGALIGAGVGAIAGALAIASVYGNATLHPTLNTAGR